MLPNQIVCSGQRRRGRPRKPTNPIPKVFALEFEWGYLDTLSEHIAIGLGVSPSQFTEELAHVALAYRPLRDLRSFAPMQAGCTQRPKLHIAILLRDIARVYSKHAKTNPKTELNKINGFREERLGDSSKKLRDKPPAVEVLARVVLRLWGDEFNETFRRQVREAIKHL